MLLEILKNGVINLKNHVDQADELVKELNKHLTHLQLRAVFNFNRTKILLKSLYTIENADYKFYNMISKYITNDDSLTLNDIQKLIEMGALRPRRVSFLQDTNVTRGNYRKLYRLDESFLLQNENELIDNFSGFNKCKYCKFIVEGKFHKSCLKKFEAFTESQNPSQNENIKFD